MPISRRGLLAAGAAAALAGCTTPPGAGPGPSSPPPTGVPTGPPTAAPAPETHPADQIPQGGLLRLAVAALPTQWNPWRPDADAAAFAVLQGPLSGAAFLVDAAGTPRPNPDYLLAATASGTPTVATLRLNPRATWDDGAPITASDWVATHAAARAGRGPEAMRTPWAAVASVRQGADSHEVIVAYTAAVADWTRPLAAGPARAASVAAGLPGAASFQPAWFSGPYVPTHADARQGVLTLERNPRWWGTHPRLDAVFVRAIAPDALPAAFAAGEFDLFTAPAADPTLAVARKATDLAAAVADSTTGRALRLSASGPLADADVRRAVVRAIDRAALVASLDWVYGAAPTPWANPLLLPAQAGYVDVTSASGLATDAEAAARGLDGAGWLLTDGRRRRGGEPLVLTFAVAGDDPRAAAEAAAVASGLAGVGVEVRLVNSGADLTPIDVPAERYPFADAAARLAPFPGLAAMSARLAATTDPQARADLAATAAAVELQQALTVPLYVEPVAVLTRNRLANLRAAGFASTDWPSVGFLP